MNIGYAELESPIGIISAAVHDGALCGLKFGEERQSIHQVIARRFGEVELVRLPKSHAIMTHLRHYFDGDIAAIEQIAVDAAGTDFQQRVWAQLRRVPAGATASYGDVAAAIGSPAAVRAVGTANGANPVAIVLPCHRVVRTGGALGGYGGGLDRKRWLLEHERTHTAATGGVRAVA